MKVWELRYLLNMSRTWHDVTVEDLANMPKKDQTDYLDRVIVAVAKGEQQWRAEV